MAEPGHRRISMTCRRCGKGFARNTRLGKHTTCPHCGEIQPGPAGLEQEQQRLAQMEEQRVQRRQRERQKPAKPAARVTKSEATRSRANVPDPNTEAAVVTG